MRSKGYRLRIGKTFSTCCITSNALYIIIEGTRGLSPLSEFSGTPSQELQNSIQSESSQGLQTNQLDDIYVEEATIKGYAVGLLLMIIQIIQIVSPYHSQQQFQIMFAILFDRHHLLSLHLSLYQMIYKFLLKI